MSDEPKNRKVSDNPEELPIFPIIEPQKPSIYTERSPEDKERVLKAVLLDVLGFRNKTKIDLRDKVLLIILLATFIILTLIVGVWIFRVYFKLP